jgi:hypothetical protein
MSWEDYVLARQLLLEERIGTRVREAQAVEREHASRAAKVIKRQR